jgi:metal-responsive CopG/Arc/MetJ family transcriptional regulator
MANANARVNVALPKDLHAAFAKYAEERGMKLTVLLRRAVEQYLAKREREKAA